MKKIIMICIIVSLSLFACSKDDNGGQGAEFDSSLYYTKTEIDQRINQLVSLHVNSNVQPDVQELAGSGWDKRTVTGWTPPSLKASYVLLRITVSNATGSTQRLTLNFSTSKDAVGDSGFDQNVPVTVNQYQKVTYYHFMSVPAVESGQVFYAWYDDAQDNAIAAGNFPSGFSVSVVPIWINSK